ncbi:MAG TPA: hypothetical protein VJ372_07620 [Pyrinomonadaceae bacterium]|nr:hypothetical protein [Pyrinomonadaceae bacterium]
MARIIWLQVIQQLAHAPIVWSTAARWRPLKDGKVTVIAELSCRPTAEREM